MRKINEEELKRMLENRAEDARRVSGTREEIRCEKAKVLTIDSIDGKEN